MWRPARYLPWLALAVVAGIVTARRLAAANDDPLVPRLTVRGQGIVGARPDVAVVALGASVRRDTADAAFDQANALIAQLNQSLRELGIPEQDVQTRQFSLSPEYGRQTGDAPAPLVGWRATHILAIKVRNFDNLGPVIDGAARILGGDAQINSISFMLENAEAATRQARNQAIADARQRAEEMATAAGVRLVRILSITESSAPPPTPVPFAAAAPVAARAPVEISAGEQNITVSVEIIYEIE